LVRERIELGQKHGDVRTDVPSKTLVQLTFTAIVYRFTMAEPFADAMGLSQPGHEQGSDEEREHVIRYVISTLRPQPR
jgi:hypothetical protein